MGFSLSWQAYADWLITSQGVDIFDAVKTAGEAYSRQHRKSFVVYQVDEIKEFFERRENPEKYNPDNIQLERRPTKCH